MTTPPFNPQPCGAGGAGSDAVDVEQTILCDTLPDGTIAGTAMAVWEYDAAGNPTGPPTFVDPATGDPYVAQGTLMPCPGETGCLEPVAFHRTTTTTSPVDHPGRQYDLDLPINPGFAVQSLQVDQVTNAANIVWDVSDPDGEKFRQDLTAFIEGRVPAAATVTITNPNAGVAQVCGAAQPMHIHIECIRLDQNPPNLIELVYNGGQDLIQNPAYNESPALNPPVSQGNYGFHLLARQDDPGPFPGFPPSGRALCTSTANSGWETNDSGRTFEIWGKDVADAQNTTPTPRGTPVQEITSDGPPAGKRSTIWQTFTAPASGNFIIRVVHGARDAGEQHRITLNNGDTSDAQNGDLIDDVSNPPSVTSSGGPNPWTQFTQTIPLTGGSTYTLALSTTNPVGGARGGLFTDMRAYIDRPDLRATATTDDDTCVVTVQETTTACQDELWSPICEAGTIQSWQNAETGAILANAAFWGQAPAPIPGPCPASASSGGGGSVAANLVHTYPVCATVGGVRTNLQRVVITDPSGGVLADSFIGPDGGPVPTPSDYDIGSCTDTVLVGDQILCDDNGPFLRKYVQDVNAVGQPQVKSHGDFTLAGTAYTPVGEVGTCGGAATLGDICYADPASPSGSRRGFLVRDGDGTAHVYDLNGAEVTPFPVILICPEASYFEEILCDQGNAGHQFLRRYVGSPINGANDTMWNFELDGHTVYAPVGPVGTCAAGEACRNSSTVLVCDVPTDGTLTVEPDIADGTVNDVGQTQFQTLPGSYTPLWSGGSLPFPATAGPGQQHAMAVGRLTATPAGCPDATGTLTVSVRVTQNGPGTGQAWDGALEIFRGTTLLVASPAAQNAPPGYVKTLTASVPITYADLAAGDVRVGLVLETFHLSAKSWTADQFTATVELTGCDSTASVQFLRTLVTDCETGEILSTTDTTLDGNPYTVTGNVAQCQPAADEECCPTSQSVILCDVAPDGTSTAFLRHLTYTAGSATPTTADFALDGTTPYVQTGTVATCSAGAGSESVVLCDSTGTRFLRTYAYDDAGEVSGFTDTDLVGAPFAPVGAVGDCGQTDSELVSLCDDNGVFQRRLSFDADGGLLGTADFTLDGDPYVPVGAVTYGCTDPTAVAQVYAACADVPRTQFAIGPNLLVNGDFERSTGQGLQSFAGPGWTTSYTACGPNLFVGPCGASTWAFFTTTAAQVMGSGANTVPAQGARSMAVNVGPNTTIPIIEWQAVYLENGHTYELSADAAVVNAPYSVAVKIGGSAAPGGLFPLSTPPTGNWGKTVAQFTYAGTTGFTQVGLYSNTGVAGGNDHVFDNIQLHEISPASAGAQTPRVYSGTQRAVIEQVVQTAGCADDRRDALLGHIADAVTPEEGANLDSTVQRQTGAGNIVIATKPRSVTLVVLAGTVSLNLGTSLAQSIPAGVTLTWAVDGPGESLVDTFTFTGVAGSDFIVTSTRQ